MYGVSSTYRTAVKELSRLWDLQLKITTGTGAVLSLGKSDVVLGSFTFMEGATCAETVQVGSTYSNSIEFELQNTDKQFSAYNFQNAIIEPKIGLWLDSLNRFEYVPLGKFYVFDSVRNFSTIPLECFDGMSKANVPMDTSAIVFPTNPASLLNAVAAQCNLMVSDSLASEVAALAFEVDSFPGNPSCRDVLAGIGIMLAKNLRVNREGYLESFWYEDSGDTTTPNNRVNNSEFSDNIVHVTGCYLEDAYGNTFSVGTADYSVELPVSPCIQGEEMASTVLAAAFERLRSLSYSPAEVYTIGDPAVQAGDIVTHESTAVGSLTLPIMLSYFKFCGTATLSSMGVPPVDLDQESTASKKLKNAFAKAESDKAELESKIAQTADQILLQVSETYADKQSVQSQIQQSAGQILQQVSETYADKQSVQSQIDQSAGQVLVQVSQNYPTNEAVQNQVEDAANQALGFVDSKYATKQAVSQLQVTLEGVSTKVQNQEGDITQLKQDAGTVSVSASTDQGTLITEIRGATEDKPAQWQAVYRDAEGKVLSGFYLDFESGIFKFDGAGRFTGALDIGNGNFIVDTSGNVTSRGDTKLYGGKLYAANSDIYAEVTSEGFSLRRVGSASEYSAGHIADLGYLEGQEDFPFLRLRSGVTGVSTIMKRFTDGTWIGTDDQLARSGTFQALASSYGLFLSTKQEKVYVVSGGLMNDIYTGEAIARFG